MAVGREVRVCSLGEVKSRTNLGSLASGTREGEESGGGEGGEGEYKVR